MSQWEPVYGIRVFTQNSYNIYRNSKHTNKVVFDLATRLLSFVVQDLLVRLLNKANFCVKEAYDSKLGFKFLSDICLLLHALKN